MNRLDWAQCSILIYCCRDLEISVYHCAKKTGSSLQLDSFSGIKKKKLNESNGYLGSE